MPDYKENAVVNREGWIRIVDGGTTRYRSPGGQEISNRQYYKLSEKYPAPHPIPEDAVSVPAGITKSSDVLTNLKATSAPTSKPQFMTGATAPKQEYYPKPPPEVPHPNPGSQRLAQQQAQAQQQQQNREPDSRGANIIAMMPEVKETPKGKRYDHRSKHPKASAQALGTGLRKLLLLITTLVVAKILNDERACMTEQEATILGMALGNLLEPTKLNENFGWVIADTGDYQAIIYVMIMYGTRINDIVQDKKQTAVGGQQARHYDQAPTAPPSQNGAVRNTTPGAFMPMNPTLKSPPGIHPGYGR